MEQISTYNIPAGLDVLLSARETGTVPAQLREPMQALVRHFTAAAAEHPIAAYLFSDDDHTERRDLFASVLGQTLAQHIPSSLVVDCDFLNSGMHGVVPEKDALGFLDYLLYGSSLGVITQEASDGVRFVGTGSFPVTKRMPFVMGAFDDAVRRFANHARCVVFVGPLYDDSGEMHPLIGAVDLPVLVSRGFGGAGRIDPVEEQIASQWDCELISVRVDAGQTVETAEPAAPLEPVGPPPLHDQAQPDAPAPPRQPEWDESPPPVEPPPPREEVAPADTTALPKTAAPTEPNLTRDTDETTAEELRSPEPDHLVEDIDYDEPRYTALVPRIVTATVGILVIAFIAWWFIQGRSRPDLASSGQDRNPVATSTDPAPVGGTDVASTDSTAAAPETTATALPVASGGEEPPIRKPEQSLQTDTLATTAVPPPVDPSDTGGRGGGTVLIGSEDIIVTGDLRDNWADWYVVHISSFRESVKAREEIVYLEANEFPVFIVFIDLGAKGEWYRVYSGPFRTRDQARDVKKNLDDLPRVRFTRISKISR